MKKQNIFTTREEWLKAAMDHLRSDFAERDYQLPENVRHAIAFTSSGKRGYMTGECWHPASSADQHYEIILRADIDDPVEVLATLTHELIHTLLPPDAKHGKAFREIAIRMGLEGPMRQTVPTPLFRERLKTITSTLGPLPHGKLDFRGNVEPKKKSGTRTIKASCGTDNCGYYFLILPKWAKSGLPVCQVNPKHGSLTCKIPQKKIEEMADEES